MNFPTLDPRWATAAGWLLTYLLHSTLLLGLALVAQRTLRGRYPALEERIWKVAMVAGLVTASLALGPTVAIPTSTTAAPVATAAEAPNVLSAAPAAALDTTGVKPAMAAMPADPSSAATTAGWAGWLLALWATGTLLLLSRFALAALRLRGRLARRLPVAHGPLARLLSRLARRAALRKPVGLSTTDRLAVPCALGFPRPEVCLPRRAIESWSTRQQETVLAHEIAHLAHRDPHWLVVLRLIEAVFFLQPLNRWASTRLEELAERRCDDWAVRQTGRPVELARCLTEVAEWITSTSPAGLARLPVPGMASGRRGAALRRRIEHLLAADSTPDTAGDSAGQTAGDTATESATRQSPRAAWLATALVLVTVAWVAPTFGPTAEAGEGAAAQEGAQAAEYRADNASPAAAAASEEELQALAEQMQAQARQLQHELMVEASNAEELRARAAADFEAQAEKLQREHRRADEERAEFAARFQAEAEQLQQRTDLSDGERAAIAAEMKARTEQLQRQMKLSETERQAVAEEMKAQAEQFQRQMKLSEAQRRARAEEMKAQAEQLQRRMQLSEDQRRELIKKMQTETEQLNQRMLLSEDERRALAETMQAEAQRLQERMRLSAEEQRALVTKMQAEAGQLQRRLSAEEQRALVTKMQAQADELRRQHLEREGRPADAEAAARALQRREGARERVLQAQADRLEQLDARQLERTLEQAMAADRALLSSGANEGLNAEELAARREALDRKVAELHRRLDEMAERLRSELTEPPVDD